MQTTRYQRVTAVAATIGLLLAPATANAFPTYSAVGKACHEEITMRALRTVRERRPQARPMPPVTRDDRALIDDLPFDVDPDMADLGAVSLLNGVRYNDLHGNAPNAVDELAQVHGDESRQREHCLRAPQQNEPSGSEEALRDCRAYVREKIGDAIDGLDGAGIPKVDDRVPLAVDLSLRGGVEVALPRYYTRMGEALHAVQDGFTHTYRAGDRTRVTVVLAYVEIVEGDHVEERDGPPHSSELDRCDADDSMRVRNVELATEATTALLEVTLDPSKTKEQKLAEVDVVLDRYFTYQPGCNAANRWCEAPEKQLPEKRSCGCLAVGASSGGAWAASGLGLCIAGLALRRRRRRRRLAASVVAFAALTIPAVARAQDETPAQPVTQDPPVTQPPPPQPAPAPPPQQVNVVAPTQEGVKEAVKEEEHMTTFGLWVAGAGSISNPGAAAMAGLRLRLGDRWALGLDGEWNGWYGINSGRMRTGAVNVYASIILRFPLRYEALNLRSTLQLGTAIQVVDLVGVPSGTTGLYAGLNPLGVEYKLSGTFYAVLYPLGVALPVPQLSGAPFAYPQYRTTLGLEISF
jgi:hypothetical protein